MAIEKDHSTPTPDGDTTVQLSPAQWSWLVVELNLRLRDTGLYQSHATELNNLFRQLTGHDHDVWTRNDGQYTPDPERIS